MEAGVITQGQVVALVNYMSQILVELIKMANLIITVTRSLACLSRINSVLEEKPDLVEGTAAVEAEAAADAPRVEFRDVSMEYQNAGDYALEQVSFRAFPGETIGVIGGTGSGKSTLVNLIPRFYDVTAGSVKIGGQDVREIPLSELRRKVGVVPQKAQLFSGTIRSNLLWGNENADDEQLWEALTVAQAREFVEKKHDGLASPVTQGGKNFSGGQKQRLTIARALVRKPQILILDDSASALDFATDAALRRSIREMQDAPTVFLVSQRASSIRYADQIIVLDDGEVTGIGRHEELLRSCPVYREIYESQFEKNTQDANGKEETRETQKGGGEA